MICGNKLQNFLVRNTFLGFLQNQADSITGLSGSGSILVLRDYQRIGAGSADNNRIACPAEAVLVSFFHTGMNMVAGVRDSA